MPRIIMPEELGGKEYRFRDRITHSISRSIRSAQAKFPNELRASPSDEKMSEAEKEEKMEKRAAFIMENPDIEDALNMAILEMIIEPKLTRADMDEMTDIELGILIESISEHIEPQMEEGRIEDLKKKVVKRSV